MNQFAALKKLKSLKVGNVILNPGAYSRHDRRMKIYKPIQGKLVILICPDGYIMSIPRDTLVELLRREMWTVEGETS